MPAQEKPDPILEERSGFWIRSSKKKPIRIQSSKKNNLVPYSILENNLDPYSIHETNLDLDSILEKNKDPNFLQILIRIRHFSKTRTRNSRKG